MFVDYYKVKAGRCISQLRLLLHHNIVSINTV